MKITTRLESLGQASTMAVDDYHGWVWASNHRENVWGQRGWSPLELFRPALSPRAEVFVSRAAH